MEHQSVSPQNLYGLEGAQHMPYYAPQAAAYYEPPNLSHGHPSSHETSRLVATPVKDNQVAPHPQASKTDGCYSLKMDMPIEDASTFSVWSWLNLLCNPCAGTCSTIAFIASHMTESYNHSKNHKLAKKKSRLAFGCNICALICYIMVIGALAGAGYAVYTYLVPEITSLMGQISSAQSQIGQLSNLGSSGSLPAGVTIPKSIG